jgi:hypothetical protein
MMTNNALKVNNSDNVAVVTQRIVKGSAVIVNEVQVCSATEDIALGHKVALVAIPAKGKVIRYGEVIVEATCPIACGEWVHVHNTQPFPGAR